MNRKSFSYSPRRSPERLGQLARRAKSNPGSMKEVSIDRALAIDGWMSDIELRWLAEQASKCTIALEVGSYKGRSTAALADHCPGHVLAVDSWPDAPIFQEFQKNQASNVLILRATSVDAAKVVGMVDFVFIDADHSYPFISEDIKVWLPHLNPGGIFSGHDYTWSGVRQAVDEQLPDKQIVDTIWWVKR